MNFCNVDLLTLVEKMKKTATILFSLLTTITFDAIAADYYQEATLSYSSILLGSVYSNEAFFINDPESPLQISDVSVVHVIECHRELTELGG